MRFAVFVASALFFGAFGAKASEQPLLDVNLNPAVFSDKLTQHSVRQSFQDSRGMLWFVTQEGLNRYTGHELESYRYSSSQPGALPTNNITRIAEDTSGNIWLSSMGGGLIFYDAILNTFVPMYADPNIPNSPYSNDVRTLYADTEGVIWLGYSNGFSAFNPAENTFHHYISGSNHIPELGDVGGFTQTEDGAIWVATELSGLLKLSHASNKLASVFTSRDSEDSIVAGALIRITTDQQGYIWVASPTGGVSRFDPDLETATNFVHIPEDRSSLSSNRVSDLFVDSKGDIWIATLEGLNLFREAERSFKRYTDSNTGLSENAIISIYQTREDKYWVGTMSGLTSGMRADFQKFNSLQGNLSHDSVNAFSETLDGSIWVGTDDGLNRLLPGADEFVWINEATAPAVSDPRVMSLFSEDDLLWIGTYEGGLNRLDLTSNKVQVFKHSELDETSIGANGITTILRVSSGQLLIGTYGGGISIFDEENSTFRNLTHDPNLPSTISNDMVLAIYEDSIGNVWVGTENGLNSYDPISESFVRYFAERGDDRSLTSHMPWTFYEDSENTLWIGTAGGGLNLWPEDERKVGHLKIRRFPQQISLPSSNIYGIQGDENGWIWVSHNKGLTRINSALLESHQYGLRDGLQAAEFTLGASYRASNGDIYFGGIQGFNRIVPNSLNLKRLPPKVSISQIKVMDQRREFDTPYYDLEEISLGYEDSMLSVEFFAADYSSPDLINYAYKLEGINPDWVISPDSRIASFTTLPSGTYMLKLAAASPDGTWNWDSFSIPITVAPPPWRSPLAYSLYFVTALFCVAFYIYGQRLKALRAKEIQRVLERRVEERTRDLEIARKLAEEATKAKSDFLATMSHEIRTPMHGIIGMTELLLHTNLNNQQQQFTNAAHKSGEALLTLINEILDFSKVEASKVELESVEFNLTELIDEICYLQGEPASRKGLNLNNICSSKSHNNLVGDPTKIRQVLMNLISNAIKFTHEGNIDVRVETRPNSESKSQAIIDIHVEDNGIGMDAATQERVFEPFTQADTSTTREYGGTGLGLTISRHYINLMDGEIVVDSTLGAGTRITVSLPLSFSGKSSQNNENFEGCSALIFTENSSTYDMLATHLAHFAISSKPLRGPVEDKMALASNFVLFVDFTPNGAMPDLKHLLGNKNCMAKVVLTPFHLEAPKLIYPDWEKLNKPITNKALQQLMTDISESNTDNLLAAPETEKQSTSLRILVAEDVETNQKIILEMLQILGHNVDIASNGLAALNLVSKNEYALVFMDCQMPVMDGYEATKSIRESEVSLDTIPIPVIALTAGSDADDRERCRQAGMDGYITKPFSLTDIQNILAKHFGEQIGSNERHGAVLESSLSNNIVESTESGTPSDVFNITAIDSIREVEQQTGKSLLPEIYDGYRKQMESKLSELNADYRNEDFDSLYRTAHAIKSMSANMGAEQVRSISAKVEGLARISNADDIDVLIKEISYAYDEFNVQFEKNFSNCSS